MKHFDFHALLHYHSEGVCSQLNYLKFHFLQFQVNISFVFLKTINDPANSLQQSCPPDHFHFSSSLFFSTLCQVEAVEADHVEDLEGSHVETTRMKRSNLTRLSQQWILNSIAGRWFLKVGAVEDTKDGSCLMLSNAIKQRLE